MGIDIGKLHLPFGIMLAPMAGVTDVTFRTICKEFGAEYTVSEMISAKALCYEQHSKRKEFNNSCTAQLATVRDVDYPMAVQLFGSEPYFLAEAAKMIESCEYKNCVSMIPPAAIDINMGCPVRKVTGNGEGSALMKNPKLAGEIVAAVKKAVNIPVTVKIRAGWDSKSINAPILAKVLEESGADLICVHARTREQLYTPGIDFDIIADTKSKVSIPVVGNGDIYSAQDAIEMIKQTGCDGVMIGRGAMGNPWIFKELISRMKNENYIAPTYNDRISIAFRHLDEIVQAKGERVGVSEGKKHISWYISGMKGAAAARTEIMTAENSSAIKSILEKLLEKQ